MKNKNILICYEVFNNIANRSNVHERFTIAKKYQHLKPHYESIEVSRIGLVHKYADNEGQKVDDKKLLQFQNDYGELLDIDVEVSPFLLLEDVQMATMEELLALKDVIVDA